MMKYLSSVFVFVFMFAASAVNAQIAGTAVDVPNGATVVADVSISDATVLSQTNDGIKVEFTITNNAADVEPNVKYAVTLSRAVAVEGSTTISSTVDEYVYKEELNLAGGQSLTKQVSYMPPVTFDGEHVVGVKAVNTSGLPLSITKAGAVQLEKKLASIDLGPDCLIFIGDGETGYQMDFGVDLLPSEELFLQCAVKNNTEHTVGFTPVTETYDRTLYGASVGKADLKPEQLAPAEAKDMRFAIKLQEKSQSYAMKMYLKDEQGAMVSNVINTRYVIQGESATIVTGSLDATSYKKGDVAVAKILIAGRADGFAEARALEGVDVSDLSAVVPNVEVTVMSNGKACGNPVTQTMGEVDAVGNVVVNVPINSNCSAPVVSTKVIDTDDRVLDAKDFSAIAGATESVVQGGNTPQAVSDTKMSVAKKIAYAVIALSLIVAVIILLMRAGSSAKVFVFALLAGTMLFVGSTQNAHAVTFLVDWTQEDTDTKNTAGSLGDWSWWDTGLWVVANPQQSSYSACDANAQIDISAEHKACNNNPSCAGLSVDGASVASLYCPQTCTGPGCTANILCNNRTFTQDVAIDASNAGANQSVAITGWRHFTCGVLPEHDYVQYTASESFGVNACSYTMGITATPAANACGSAGQGNVNVSVTTDAPNPEFQYRCGGGNWSTWRSTNTFACSTFDAPGTYTVEAQVRSGSNGTAVYDSTTVVLSACGTNGVCGVSNGTTLSGAPLSGLCAAGQESVVTGSGPWSWTCDGLSGGTPATCSANITPPTTGPACGNNNMPAAPTPSEKCVPAAVPTNESGSGTVADPWEWQCQVGSVTSETCRAQYGTPGTGPACNSTTLTAAPTPSEKCIAPAVTAAPGLTGTGSSADPFRWRCEIGGVTSEECIGQLAVGPDPVCGSAHNTPSLFDVPGATNPAALCAEGTATAVLTTGGDWAWTCSNGVTTASCSAQKSCPADQFACNDQCVSIVTSAPQSVNLKRDGSTVDPVDVSVNYAGGTCGFNPECEVSSGGTTQSIVMGNTVSIDILPHGNSTSQALTVTCDRPQQCDPAVENCTDPNNDPNPRRDTDVNVENRDIQCVCTARACSPSGTCVATPVFASSYGDSKCSSSCQTNADCAGGGIVEVQP